MIKKLSKNFIGDCSISELKTGVYFKTINAKGKMSKEVYSVNHYDRCLKKYACDCFSDISVWKLFKPTQKVTTNFEF